MNKPQCNLSLQGFGTVDWRRTRTGNIEGREVIAAGGG